MDCIVFVNWEGRGYTNDSWEKDKSNVARLLGIAVTPAPIEFCCYDVGIMVKRVGTSPDVVISTRHGQVFQPESITELVADEEDNPLEMNWDGPYQSVQDIEDKNPEFFSGS